jgi:hypothetical protein
MRIGQTIVVKQNANNSELQRAIEAIIPAATKQAASIANRYKGKNEAETCKKIFDYLKNNINYKADGTNQAVRLPSGLMRTAQGDCKSYSVFTSAILSNLGIPHKLVYASYDPKDPTPTHIYVMTKSGCIIDAVYGKFNAEKKATYKKYKDMNISYIAGMNKRRRIGNMGRYGTGGACGIGAVTTGETWAKNLGIWNTIPNGVKLNFYKNLVLPPYIGGREIIKALLRKNSGGFANALARVYEVAKANNASDEFKKYRAMELLWLQKGGNPDDLRVAFQQGNSKTPTGAKFNEVLKKAKAGQSISVGEAIAAAVSALFGKKYDPSTGKVIGATGAEELPVVLATAPVWLPILREVVAILGGSFNVGGAQPATGENVDSQGGGQGGEGTQSKFAQSGLLPVLLIGGAAAAYFILKPTKK